MTDAAPRIALVEPDPGRAAALADGLRADGWPDVTVVPATRGLARRIEEVRPDIVLIDLAEPSRDELEALSLAAGAADRPVAMFVDRSAPDLSRSAVAAGLSAYVVDGLDPRRVRPVVETAIARFAAQRALRAELDAAKAALEERKAVDRAKGVLMDARGLSEAEAYALLRRTAMDRGTKLADLARSIVAAADLLR
ncbi:MAG: ANTAR domain-containing response regulator [Hasllibacter sp.]